MVKSTKLKSKLYSGLNLYVVIHYHEYTYERILNIRMNKHRLLSTMNCVSFRRTIGHKFRQLLDRQYRQQGWTLLNSKTIFQKMYISIPGLNLFPLFPLVSVLSLLWWNSSFLILNKKPC